MTQIWDFISASYHQLLDDGVLLKLSLSAIFGLIIGLDRELKKKPLGLKTCLVLSVSSCLLTIVSIQSVYTFPHDEKITMDPLRLAAQIISGVGFIGAGVILKRNNEVIVGLTTAAMIWGAAGIGIAVGAGYYMESLLGLLVILFGVDILPGSLRKFGPKALRLREMDVILTIQEGEGDSVESILNQFTANKITIKTTTIRSVDQHHLQMQLRIEVDSKRSVVEIFRLIQKINVVKDVDLRSY